MMKRWTQTLLAALMLTSAAAVKAQSEKPMLKINCNILAVTFTLTAHMEDGDKTIDISSKLAAPIPLTAGMNYTLSGTRKGYTPYRKTFPADWEGIKDRNITMEKGTGPDPQETWTVDLDNSVYMDFVPIPVGSFMMGSEEGEDNELPVHNVSFSRPFWMAKTEVNQQQYGQFRTAPKPEIRKGIPTPTGSTYPAFGISWHDARSFCSWLTSRERALGRLPEGYEYSLPTEAEWEYACRAGTTKEYAGKIDNMAWFDQNSSDKPSAVGAKSPNAWGLYDMHGGVWEWCEDIWYADYNGALQDGSQRGFSPLQYHVDRALWGEKGNQIRFYNGGLRVMRGGCWNYPVSACRSANRFYQEPGEKAHHFGFRPILIWNPPTLSAEVTRELQP